MTHTPGPWRVSDYDDFIIVGNNSQIGKCHGAMLPNEERRANARLIAAAPKMLAALKDLVELAESIRPFRQALGAAESLAQAHTAIAEAEGRS